MKRRLLHVFLAVVLCLQMLSFTPITFAAASSNDVAVNVLSALSILLGDENGDFHLDDEITREEYTTLILRLMNYESVAQSYSSDVSYFNDVDSNHWAYGYVNTAKSLELVDGISDTEFGVGSNIKWSEALKILVCAVGYRVMGEQLGGYPDGYIAAASQLGLMKNTDMRGSFSRNDACRIIYNALFVEIMDREGTILDDRTILTENHDITIIEGTLDSTYNFQGGYSLTKGYIVVSGQKYRAEIANADNLVGNRIKAYVKETGGEATVYYIESIGITETLTVDAYDIEPDTSLTRFRYFDEAASKIQSVGLESGIKVYYNGDLVPTADVTAQTLMPRQGKVVLKDTDNNGNFDVAMITEYQNYIVSYRNEDEIYVKWGNKIDLNSESTIFIKNGEEISSDEIINGDIISVCTGYNGERSVIYVADQYEQGTVKLLQKSSAEKTIYTFTDEYGEVKKLRLAHNYVDAVANREMGVINVKADNKTIYKMYTDYFGDVADIELIETSNDAQYGYVYEMQLGDGGEDLYIEMLTANNRFEFLKTASNDKIIFNNGIGNEAKTSAKEIYETLETRQIVKYYVNEENEIIKLYAARTESQYFTRTAIGDITYTYNNGMISNRWVLDSDTIVFGTNLDGQYKDAMFVGKYYEALKNGISSTMVMYDVDGMVPKAVLLPNRLPTRYDEVTDGYEFPVNYVNSPILYINDITYAIAEDDEEYVYLHGYENGKEVSVPLAAEAEWYSEPFENLKPGMAIQYTSNKEHKMNSLTAEIVTCLVNYRTVCDFTQLSDTGILWDYEPVSRIRSRITTAWGDVLDGDLTYTSVSTADGYLTAVFNEQTMMLEYDKQNDTFTMIENKGLNTGDKVFLRQRYGNTRELVIYERLGD